MFTLQLFIYIFYYIHLNIPHIHSSSMYVFNISSIKIIYQFILLSEIRNLIKKQMNFELLLLNETPTLC